MKKMMLWKITIVTLVFLGSGCATVPGRQETGKLKLPGKSEPVKWVGVGTLVSVGPARKSARHPDPVKSAIFGETRFSRTRVETTEGVYTVGEKIGVVETGIPVSVGYGASDEYPEAPSYLKLGGKRYELVR